MVFIVGLDSVCPAPHVTAAPQSSPKLYFIELFARVKVLTLVNGILGALVGVTGGCAVFNIYREECLVTKMSLSCK